ncbi:hypothetical protein H2201_005492 [Coniosporium apollinis]|uniref:Xylanolytic transcriptional activator regulatory domain-containing protein n=1 Tax=Coniosporium apollinis TaxID=61459 RepID=A0ABQ9NSX1_9PEZI|nr:hypothetical protein H2201_005492 [Coniosporium apollinis]
MTVAEPDSPSDTFFNDLSQSYDYQNADSGPPNGRTRNQVETLLKTQDSTAEPANNGRDAVNQTFPMGPLPQHIRGSGAEASNTNIMNDDDVAQMFDASNLTPPDSFPMMQNNSLGDAATSNEEQFSWEMIGLGLDEPLPNQDVINELHQIFFDKIHPSVSMIHKPRYLAAMNLAPHMRPPVCLRYIMWCMAASVTEKYDALQEHFYMRARKYAQMDEMKGHGEATLTLAHTQAWVLIASYEFKLMYFPRAWLSVGRAVRLSQMMQLHRMDGVGLDVKQCLQPPRDWTEREERRRTFWMCFCIDRYASIGTGWPMTIDERDILSNLPATDDSFDRSRPMTSITLEEALSPSGAASLSPLAGVAVMACLFGRNLTHLHRPSPNDNDADLNGEYWRRHRAMENYLLNIAMALPDQLRLPANLSNANAVFLNMCIHTSAICLHQAAIFKADKFNLPPNVATESKIRCVTAAAEIASIMRMICHLDLSAMNPFISFSVYVAARVFVQYLRTKPKDESISSSLQFLVQAMQALKRKNPLTESFLAQLDLDLQSAGLPPSQPRNECYQAGPATEIPRNTDSVGCIALYEIRESQLPPQQRTRHPTFGDHGLSAHTNPNRSPESESPGPPFHVARPVSLDVPPAPPFGFDPRQNSRKSAPNFDYLPQTGTVIPQVGVDARVHTLADQLLNTNAGGDTDMDASPDHSGDQATPSDSRHGSSATNSYTSPQEHSARHASSPPQNINRPGFGSTGGASQPFFSNVPVTDDFAAMAAGFPDPPEAFSWDISGSGTGFSPLPDGSWDQVLGDIGGSWNGLLAQTGDGYMGKRTG